MSATLFSLLAVTIGFSALIAWVYWPSNRQKLEGYGRIPLDIDGSPDELRTIKPGSNTRSATDEPATTDDSHGART